VSTGPKTSSAVAGTDHAPPAADEVRGGPRLIELPVRRDRRGSLTALEEGTQVPFEIRRVFYIYDVTPGATRASHAVTDVDEVVIAVSGCFHVTTVDGVDRREFTVERPTEGLFIPGRAWRELSGFSDGAVCLVLASKPYEPSDYSAEHAAAGEG
jgi:dTDP-4-dehydrorhamnose 3,5-epimerase-like enzyme